jgi:thiosulfate/3-mercaptopyruvate sulfurtransferase
MPDATPALIDAATLRGLLAVHRAAHGAALGAARSADAPDARDADEAAEAGDLLLLDCRFNLADTAAGEAAWRAGHVPGARYAHLDRDLSGPKVGQGTPAFTGRHPLPAPEALARTLGAWGLRPDTRVIAYDDAGGMFAARAWWLLRWLGHAHVQVLDGGWPAWLAVGGEVDTTPPAPRQPTVVTPRPHMDWLVSAPDVLASLGARTPTLQLLDARAPDRFRGENETLDPVGGHIPGACNRFFQLNLVDGRFKPAATLREEFTALVAGQPLEALVHQCGSGVTACHNLLAMAHADLPVTRLYAGSWSEWCADPARPVA